MSKRDRRTLEEEAEAERKGYASENMTQEALNILMETGHIHDFYRSIRGLELDSNLAADFVIWLESNTVVFLQVKSSEKYRQKHLSLHGHRVPYCIVIDPVDDSATVAHKILVELGLNVQPLADFLDEIVQEMADSALFELHTPAGS